MSKLHEICDVVRSQTLGRARVAKATMIGCVAIGTIATCCLLMAFRADGDEASHAAIEATLLDQMETRVVFVGASHQLTGEVNYEAVSHNYTIQVDVDPFVTRIQDELRKLEAEGYEFIQLTPVLVGRCRSTKLCGDSASAYGVGASITDGVLLVVRRVRD